jgi:hypothetical protein
MKRSAMLLCVALAASSQLPWSAEAQTKSRSGAKPRNAASHIVPMAPDTLTLYPYGRPTRPQAVYSFTPNRFDQPSPINNTFMGARYY